MTARDTVCIIALMEHYTVTIVFLQKRKLIDLKENTPYLSADDKQPIRGENIEDTNKENQLQIWARNNFKTRV